MRNKPRRKGASLIEFTLIGIPTLFAWISIIDIARGVWHYTTLQHAIKTTAQYVSVHGEDCGIPPNNCPIKVKDVVQIFATQAIGVPPAEVKLTLTAQSGTTVVCDPVGACSANTTIWPPITPSYDPDNVIGKVITIRGDYLYRPVVAMVFGGKAVTFGKVNLYGYSRQVIAF